MTAEHRAALMHGKLVKAQSFDTPKGKYEILIIRRKGQVFLFKYLNSKLVESCNLNQLPGTPMEEIQKAVNSDG